MVITNVAGVFHNNFFKINFNQDKLFRDFLLYFLKSEYTQFLLKTYAGTTTIPDLTHSDFYSIKIKLPSKQEQQKIAKLLTLADKEIELLKKELETLKEQKHGLMQRLLTGEVRVKV
jgi:type I restriction enzyme S subunit